MKIQPVSAHCEPQDQEPQGEVPSTFDWLFLPHTPNDRMAISPFIAKASVCVCGTRWHDGTILHQSLRHQIILMVYETGKAGVRHRGVDRS